METTNFLGKEWGATDSFVQSAKAHESTWDALFENVRKERQKIIVERATGGGFQIVWKRRDQTTGQPLLFSEYQDKAMLWVHDAIEHATGGKVNSVLTKDPNSFYATYRLVNEGAARLRRHLKYRDKKLVYLHEIKKDGKRCRVLSHHETRPESDRDPSVFFAFTIGEWEPEKPTRAFWGSVKSSVEPILGVALRRFNKCDLPGVFAFEATISERNAKDLNRCNIFDVNLLEQRALYKSLYKRAAAEPEPPEPPKAEEAPQSDLTEAQKTENFFAKVEHDRKMLNLCRQLEEQAEADILKQLEPHKDYLQAVINDEAPFTLERRQKQDGTWEIVLGAAERGHHLVNAGHAPARAQRILLDSFFAPHGCTISEDRRPGCFFVSPSTKRLTDSGIRWTTWRVLWESSRDHYPYLSDAEQALPTDDRPISVYLAEFKLKGTEHYTYHLVSKVGGDGRGNFGNVCFQGKQRPPEVAIINLKAQAKEHGWTLRRGRAALDATEQTKGGDFVYTHYELRPTKRFLEQNQEMRERLRALSLEEGRETREEARQHLPDFEPPHACDRAPGEQMAEVVKAHLAPHFDALNQAIDRHIEANITAPKAPKAPTPEPDPQPDRVQEQAPEPPKAPEPDPEPTPEPALAPEPPPSPRNESRIAVMRPRLAPYQLSLF